MGFGCVSLVVLDVDDRTGFDARHGWDVGTVGSLSVLRFVERQSPRWTRTRRLPRSASTWRNQLISWFRLPLF